MRFHPSGPPLPDALLHRCDEGRVVFLCGAGVSQPSGLPGFVRLTRQVIEYFDPADDSAVMTAFQPWLDARGAVPLDQIFSLLHEDYGVSQVNALVARFLASPLPPGTLPREHDLIRRISANARGVPQVVTTNFDTLFEVGKPAGEPIHMAPALPQLAYGAAVEGITYLHGRLSPADEADHRYILSSADLGRAYLSEGWATTFIRHLLANHTVVLIGYQAEDPPVRYLLQGLSRDSTHDRSRLYAFDMGRPEDIEAKWRDRGVTAIPYPNHGDLWLTLEGWASRADNPRAWRQSVIATSQRDPEGLAPHQRGQVAHLLRTVEGATLFATAAPPPHPDWICVLDANIRSSLRDQAPDQDKQPDAPLTYGLDDDRRHIPEEARRQGARNDDLLSWREGDDNPGLLHRLGGRPAPGFEPQPIRLGKLTAWLAKSLAHPVTAWWAIQQQGLHPNLMQQIEWHLRQADLPERARHIWRLILESQRDSRNRDPDLGWYGFKERLGAGDWTPTILRDFSRLAAPRIQISPATTPPTGDWGAISLTSFGTFKITFFERYNRPLDLPDSALPAAFATIEDHLITASRLLTEVETSYFTTPTCYPDREIDGRPFTDDFDEVLTLFVALFDRLVRVDPAVAKAHATTWPSADPWVFPKLRLYALAQPAVFSADEAAAALLALDQTIFWNYHVARELLFLLVDRWPEFSPVHRDQLFGRILAGPDKRPHWSDDEFPHLRNTTAAPYARYLQLQGCEITDIQSAALLQLISAISDWRDGWAQSVATLYGMRGGVVTIDEASDDLVSLPTDQIVAEARKIRSDRDFSSLTEKRPFIGLVKTDPEKALAALDHSANRSEFPKDMWSELLDNQPDNLSPADKQRLLHQLLALPHPIVFELRYTVGRWLQKNLASLITDDQSLGWAVFDHVVSGLLSAGPDGTESALGEVRQGGQIVERSRRTLTHALNGPIGQCAEALINVVSDATSAEGLPAQVKSRFERLFAAVGEGSDHAILMVMAQLNWIMHIDPVWAQSRLIPMLAFDHPAAEPAWNGFLNGRNPSAELATALKPLLRDLFPWIERFSDSDRVAETAAQWLGYRRIFAPDAPGGLTAREMAQAIRGMSEETRKALIFWLGSVGKRNEAGWHRFVVPFIEQTWPKELRFRTSDAVRSWIGILDDTGDDFPTVFAAVKPLLAPVESDPLMLHHFAGDTDKNCLTTRFPDVTLELLNSVIPALPAGLPYQFPKMLEAIVETDPALSTDPRYLRLSDLISRY